MISENNIDKDNLYINYIYKIFICYNSSSFLIMRGEISEDRGF